MLDSYRFRPVYWISVFVPPGHVEQVLSAVLNVDSLGGGDYDCVHWVIEGASERFRPLAGAIPAAGRVGELHASDSVLLVMAIERDEQRLQRLLDEALFPAHPWESPAVFVDESFQPLPSQSL